MKYLSLLFFLFLSLPIMAQEYIEPCKYGQPLIDAIQAAYTPNNPLGYGPGRDILYSQIDNNGLELSGVYTNFTVTLNPDADPSVSAFQGGAGLNAEHVYPQSKGAGDEPARSDLHNIFPSKVNVNESRGSCPFGEIADNDTDIWFYLNTQLNSIPNSDIEKYSEKDEEDCVFEPREEVKGNIARAVFYFYAIYQTIADSRDANFFHIQKETLYQWHLADPVDAIEEERNTLIAAQQGNENPFISDSTLAWRAYFEEDASYPEGDSNCYPITTDIEEWNTEDWVRISSNFVRNEMTVSSQKEAGSIRIFDIYGRFIRQWNMKQETQLQLDDFKQGFYILHIHSEGSTKAFRFFKQ